MKIKLHLNTGNTIIVRDVIDYTYGHRDGKIYKYNLKFRQWAVLTKRALSKIPFVSFREFMFINVDAIIAIERA